MSEELRLVIEVVEGRNLVAMDSTGTSDPYVIVTVGAKEKRTKIVRMTLAPKWTIGSQAEKFKFRVKPGIEEILFKCMDWDRFSADDRMGQVTVKLSELQVGSIKDDWFRLVPQKTGDPVSGELRLKMQLIDPKAAAKKQAAKQSRTADPLLSAIIQNDVKKLDELMNTKIDVNKVDDHGFSPLHIACNKDAWNEGAVQVVLKLLNEPQTNVKLSNQDKNTAFHYFCKKFTAPHVVGPFLRFIERGVDVNAQNCYGETPLHQAVFNPSLKNVLLDLLVKQGANPNIGADTGETPLHYAVRMGREDVVKFLVASGAEVDMKNKAGKTPRDTALEENHPEVAELFMDVKELLEWLKVSGLSQFTEEFVKNDIFMYIVPDLNEDILVKILSDPVDRQKVLVEAKKLTAEEPTEEGKKKRDKLLKQLAMRKQESETADKSGAGDADIAWEIDPRDLEFSQSLGMGSSGEVFEGTFMGNKVAVKVLKTNDTANEIEEFKKEFQVLVTMNSPYVIKFYGASLAEKLCMVMEHCARGSLYDVLNKKDLDLTWDRFFTFAKQSVAGVMALHKYNPAILHRDLKTLNALVTEDWQVKICDFGLSRFNTGSNLATLSKCRGTYAYIAPEVYNCEQFTTRSDMYSVGMMIWELLNRTVTGKYMRPFQEYKQIQFDFQILIQACKMKLRPTFNPACPPVLVELVKRCWHEVRDQRLESWECLEALTEIEKQYQANKAEWDAILPPKAT